MYQYKRRIPKNLMTSEVKHYLQNDEIHELFESFEKYSISYYQLFEEFFYKISIDEFKNVYMLFLVPARSLLNLEIKDSHLLNFVNKDISLDIFSTFDKKILLEEKKLSRKQKQSKSYLKQLTRLSNLKKFRKRKEQNYFATLAQIIGYSTKEINIQVDSDYSEFLFFLRKFNKRVKVKPH